MAIYKRYNTRKRKINRALLLWIAAILLIFAITAVIGYALGKRAAGAESYLPTVTVPTHEDESVAPIAKSTIHAEYVPPESLAAQTGDEPDTTLSTWIYRDGAATFVTAVDAGLGKDVSTLPAFTASAKTSGLFAVRSIYADASVREILFTYETALLAEYAGTGLSEIVLVFERMDAETMSDAFALADTLPQGAVLCVPYALLHSEFAPRFFSEATERGYTLALLADADTAKTLAADTEDYAFSFTRYQLRLLLEGKDAALLDILQEKDLLNYQFISPRNN